MSNKAPCCSLPNFCEYLIKFPAAGPSGWQRGNISSPYRSRGNSLTHTHKMVCLLVGTPVREYVFVNVPTSWSGCLFREGGEWQWVILERQRILPQEWHGPYQLNSLNLVTKSGIKSPFLLQKNCEDQGLKSRKLCLSHNVTVSGILKVMIIFLISKLRIVCLAHCLPVALYFCVTFVLKSKTLQYVPILSPNIDTSNNQWL